MSLKKLFAFVVLLGVGVYFLAPIAAPTCYIGVGWVGTVQTCECIGYEWLVENEMPSDGNDRSVCLGYISSITETGASNISE